MTFAFDLLWLLRLLCASCTFVKIGELIVFMLLLFYIWVITVTKLSSLNEISKGALLWKSSEQPGIISILGNWVGWEPFESSWNIAMICPEGRSHLLQSYNIIWGIRNCLLKGFCKMTGNWLYGLRISPLIMCEIQRMGSWPMFCLQMIAIMLS